MAIFPGLCQSLQTETKQQIFQQHRRGDSTETLAQRFCRTRTSIYHIIKEIRAARIMELPLDSMGNEQFDCLRSEQKQCEILGPLPECDLPAKKSQVPSGMPPYLASLYEVPLLTREQETHLFRKMNYLKYEANKLRETLDLDQPKRHLMDRIENLYEESVAAKNQIISANLRLVVSIAKRYIRPAGDFFELVSDGNMSLIRAVEKFDVSRGNRFSTYATWAIINNFALTVSEGRRHRDQFRTTSFQLFATAAEVPADHRELEAAHTRRKTALDGILRRLNDREREIIVCRYGLRPGNGAQTLQQLGDTMGVTKERVRQIEARALRKLRQAVV